VLPKTDCGPLLFLLKSSKQQERLEVEGESERVKEALIDIGASFERH